MRWPVLLAHLTRTHTQHTHWISPKPIQRNWKEKAYWCVHRWSVSALAGDGNRNTPILSFLNCIKTANVFYGNDTHINRCASFLSMNRNGRQSAIDPSAILETEKKVPNNQRRQVRVAHAYNLSQHMLTSVQVWHLIHHVQRVRSTIFYYVVAERSHPAEFMHISFSATERERGEGGGGV